MDSPLDIRLSEQQIYLPFGKTSHTVSRLGKEENEKKQSANVSSSSFLNPWTPQDDHDNPNVSQDLFLSHQSFSANLQKNVSCSKFCGTPIRQNIEDRLGAEVAVAYLQYDELPHPRKLFNRKKRATRRKLLSDPANPQVKKSNQNTVDLHLMQLKVKQSRRIYERYDASSITGDSVNADDSSEIEKRKDVSEILTSPVVQQCLVLHDVPTNVPEAKTLFFGNDIKLSSWDDVESSIHSRWKSKTRHRHVEEE